MISKKTITAFYKFLSFIGKSRFIPIRWSAEEERIFPITSKFFLRQIQLYVCILLLKVFLQMVTVFTSYRTEKGGPQMLDIVFMLLFASAAVVAIFFYRHSRSIVQCIEAFTTYFKTQAKKKPGRKRCMPDVLLEEFTRALPLGTILTSLPISLLGVVEPENPRNFFGALPTYLQSRFPGIFWLLFILEVYLMQAAVCSIFLIYTVTLTYTLGTFLLLRDLRLNLLSDFIGANTTNNNNKQVKKYARLLLRTRETVVLFKQLYILNSWFKSAFTALIINLVSTMVSCHVLIIYISVRLHNVLPIFTLAPFATWSIGAVPMLCIYILVLAQIHDYSQKVLGNLRRRVLPQERRCVRLLPFGLRLAGTIKRTTPLTVMMIVFRMSRTLLIIF